MSDLISREKLLDTLGKLVIEYDISPHWDDTRTESQKATDHAELVIACIKELVSEQPTIDAVPVIRCHDCIHYMTDDPNEEWCECTGCAVNVDGYCADGERRTDE